jgi:hypothetical protein
MPTITRREWTKPIYKTHEEMFHAFARAASDILDYGNPPPKVVNLIERALEALFAYGARHLEQGEYHELTLGYAGRLLDEQERLEERLERELADDDCRGCA